MIQDVVSFLHQLEANNNKPWFDQHREEYKRLAQEFELFVGQLIQGIGQFDPSVKFLSPKECIWRIYRDTRFSKDKTPYKTWFAARFVSGGGKGDELPGYFCRISSDATTRTGGGQWAIQPRRLLQLRQKISENPKELEALLSDSGFVTRFGTLGGEQLKNVPKGFSKDDPAAELLKYKNFITGTSWNIGRATDQELHAQILENFRVLHPLVEYLRVVE